MKILSAEQIRQLDKHTIQHEPIASIDLMERASLTFFNWLLEFDSWIEEQQHFCIFCGPGNNGGDGLAVARMLHRERHEVTVYLCEIGKERSTDFKTNLKRLAKFRSLSVLPIQEGDAFPELPEDTILIDAIFGAGLNRPVTGYWEKLLQWLNQQTHRRIAIDIPSGLFADQHSSGTTFQAQETFSFELPKLAFFYPENDLAVGNWSFASIGLDADFIAQQASDYFFLEHLLARSILKDRGKYDHKGTYGHALMIVGSYGKIGAAILASRAALRSGAGLVSIHAPKCAYAILQSSIPEAMVSSDRHEFIFTQSPDLSSYRAIGIGCGLGTDILSAKALKQLLDESTVPLVLDADALNILSQNPTWLHKIPPNSILTPHPREFERLFGETPDNFAQNDLQRQKAKELQVYIILKRAHTAIACPDGSCYFNATGNPGMATGGSGDVLTGIITGLLAQNYSSRDAALLGVYLHGLAGDLAVERLRSPEALIASDLIEFLGHAFRDLREDAEYTDFSFDNSSDDDFF